MPTHISALDAAFLRETAAAAESKRAALRAEAAEVNKAIMRARAKRYRLLDKNRGTQYILSCNDEIAELMSRRDKIRDAITSASKVIRASRQKERYRSTNAAQPAPHAQAMPEPAEPLPRDLLDEELDKVLTS